MGVTESLSRAAYFGAEKNAQYTVYAASINKAREMVIDSDRLIIAPFGKQFNLLEIDANTYSSDVAAISDSNKITVIGIEYLWDPRPIFRKIRQILIAGGEAEVFIGLKGGYYRWSVATVSSFIQALGMQIRTVDEGPEFTKLTLECSQQSYDSFLRSQHLPSSKFRHLIVTTEHADYRVTGGIGSYVKECDNLYGDDVAILIIDNSETLDRAKIADHRWLSAQSFIGDQRVTDIHSFNYDTYGDIVQEALECIVALYDSVESVESQEMLLNRVIDAKRIQLLPRQTRLITMCHGSSTHLAKAKRTVLDAENVHVAYREKYSIEYSDTVILPTNFLRSSYVDSGLESLEDPSRITKRLPFDLSQIPEGKPLERYERLIYIGKTSTIKGFDLFLESLIKLYDNHSSLVSQVKEVVVVVTYVDIKESYLRSLYEEAKKLFNIRIVSFSRSDLFETLSEYSKDSLALVTYRGDNHPLAVLELMAIGVDFVAANAAGTPELIIDGYEAHNLAPAEPNRYADAIATALKNAKARSPKVAQIKKQYRQQQERINRSYSLDELRTMPTLTHSVVTDNLPVHIEIIGDKQTDNYQTTLKSINAQTYPGVTVGRKQEEAHYMRLYAGDILEPYAIEMMVRAFHDTKISAVMADEFVMAYEGDGRRKGIEEFHPYPPQIGSVFLQEKYSRRTVALFRRYPGRESYSDWLRCVTLTCEGFGVRVVPMRLISLIDLPDYFTNDPVTLSSQFSHSFTALSVFDASILYSELRRFDDIYWGLKRVNHLEDYFVPRAEIGPSVSAKVVRVVGAYERFTPDFIKIVISSISDCAFWLLRRIKYAIRKTSSSDTDRALK